MYKGTDKAAAEGRYCIDLVSDDYSIEVEVERTSNTSALFSQNYPEFSLIVSKFEKYFRAADGKQRYMVYVLDNGEKISIISGDDIRNTYFRNVVCKWFPSQHTEKVHLIHAYMMTIGIAATFEVSTMKPIYIGKNCSWTKKNNTIQNILNSAEVDYQVGSLDNIPVEN